MIEYLSAIGLKAYRDEKKLQKLITDIVSSPSHKYVNKQKNKDVLRVEYEKTYSDKTGLVVRGVLEEKELIINYFMPYALGDCRIDMMEAEVETVQEHTQYHVFGEETRTGTQIDFTLQNVMDYLDVEDDDKASIEGAHLMGLSIDGKIILNVDKDLIESEMEDEDEEWRTELLRKARSGDLEARALLEIEAEEMEDMIEERLQEEDIFSILEGFFMPMDDGDGLYSVLGTIKDMSIIENEVSGEVVYNFYINSIGIEFELCINKEDLVGEPSVGMRFLGTCLLQGKLLFDN